MQQVNRILQIFLFHLARRVVNRLPASVILVLTGVVVVVLLALPHLPDWVKALGFSG